MVYRFRDCERAQVCVYVGRGKKFDARQSTQTILGQGHAHSFNLTEDNDLRLRSTSTKVWPSPKTILRILLESQSNNN